MKKEIQIRERIKIKKKIDWFFVMVLSWVFAVGIIQVTKYIQLQKRKPVLIGEVSVYMYNPVKSQTDSSPFYTSVGERVREGIIAVSEDLLQKLNYYDMVYVKELDRYFYVMDLMNKRHKKSIDIFSYDIKKSEAFGKKTFTLYLCQKMQKYDGKILSDFRVYGKVDWNKIRSLNEDYLNE